MQERIKRVVRAISADERLEARWLNTLSYLEYAGARKISRTVAATHPGLDVLDHLADEARHAATFAGLAAKVLGSECSDYLCREAASRYFNKLDLELSAWATELVGAAHPVLNYLLVTSMTERRARTLYPLYKGATSVPGVRDALVDILTQEQAHGARIEEACIRMLSEWDIASLQAPSVVEAAFFADFLTAIEVEIGLDEPRAAA